MGKLRVVFMGTPDFAVPTLEKLLAAKHDIVAVVTQPDRPKGRGQRLAASPVKEFATRQGLTVLQPEKIKDPAFIDRMIQIRPDVIVVVAFGQFLPKGLLDLPPLGCINVHASLLPQYRGAAPIHWAIINGETKTGVTIMQMDIGMDTGDMILKAETPIGPDETTGELHDRLKWMGAELLVRSLELLVAGNAPRIPQDNGAASYAPLLTRDIEQVDWYRSAINVHNLVRGLNPWPGAYTMHGGKTLKVWRTRIIDGHARSVSPGTVVDVCHDGIVVATGQGLIQLTEVQPESKKRMQACEYARGYSLCAGDILG
ncbi:methionyl-tRNA formyltransferase [Sporolituus thermophilus]|uniref:Methionyl-tRNA formyltransferase n=1 Tax=Sporolituus thermophilus DSM 23256 TaxID=1123285 RepID=A0A1G7KSN6_9FIRM|nr:methionyl-tRNA formyltransferase [Sporolituus thermophilus]SDF40233.1 methionyl-tRNA formyltransferase [Sporolituus thermophilus DSM 23256]